MFTILQINQIYRIFRFFRKYKIQIALNIPKNIYKPQVHPQEMFEDLTSFVVDAGTHSTRLGYGGDDSPKIIAPSYVASQVTMDGDQKNLVAGSKYLSLDRTDLEIQSIFKTKNDDLSYNINPANYAQFLEHLLVKEMKINIRDYSLLFSEDINLKPSQLLVQRQQIANIAFEKLGVSNIFFLKSPVLACFATGRSTAIVVDSGQNSTRITAVHEGFVLNKTSKVLDCGGKNLNDEFQRYIENELNKPLKSRFEIRQIPYTKSFLKFQKKALIEDIKQSCASSSQQSQQNSEISYELPDQQIIKINKANIKDLFISPLAPQQSRQQLISIPAAIVDTINNSDIDIKKQLYSNVLMTGGNFLYNGQVFSNQVLSKISSLSPPNAKVKSVSLCANSERRYLSWIGGSIVSCLSAFQSYWVGKEEYETSGASILQKKCM